MRAATVLIMATVMWASSAVSQYSFSGNDLLAGCKAFVEQSAPHGAGYPEAIHMGICIGSIKAVQDLGTGLGPPRRSCPPKDSDLSQAARVAVSFLERHPERLQEPLLILVADALAAAWPCPR
jgi:hypothetical protein